MIFSEIIQANDNTEIETKSSNVTDYLSGLVSGIQGAVIIISDMAMHPIDNIIIPMGMFLNDVRVIEVCRRHGFNISSYQNVTLDEYQQAKDRMVERATAITKFIEHFANASGPEALKIITSIGVTSMLPGTVAGASFKIASNYYRYRIFTNPLKFQNMKPDDLKQLKKTDIISVAEFRELKGNTLHKFVVLPSNQFIMSRDLRKGTEALTHADLSNGKPVICAGEFKGIHGYSKDAIDHSGHFIPQGPNQAKIAECILIENSLVELEGKFKSKKTSEKYGNIIREPLVKPIVILPSVVPAARIVIETITEVQRKIGLSDQQIAVEHHERAVKLFCDGKYNAALLASEEATTLDYYNHEAWCLKGSCHAELDQCDDALKCYDHSVFLKQGDAGWTYWNRGNFYFDKLHNSEKAISDLNQFFNKTNGPIAIKKITEIQRKSGLSDQQIAVEHHERAVKLFCDGKYKAALLASEEATTLDYYNHEAWCLKGSCHGKLGQSEDARKSNEHAVWLKPKHDDKPVNDLSEKFKTMRLDSNKQKKEYDRRATDSKASNDKARATANKMLQDSIKHKNERIKKEKAAAEENLSRTKKSHDRYVKYQKEKSNSTQGQSAVTYLPGYSNGCWKGWEPCPDKPGYCQPGPKIIGIKFGKK